MYVFDPSDPSTGKHISVPVFVRVEGRDVHAAHLELADPGSQVLDVTVEADELRDGVLGHVPRAAPQLS
jgi:hypothetical protein